MRTPYSTPSSKLFSWCLAVLVVLTSFSGVVAQVPEPVLATGYSGPVNAEDAARIVPCAGNEAGSLLPGPSVAQSNDLTLDTIFFCFGDELQIRHNRDQRLDGDPDLSTPAGVGYAWYECVPTSDGPTLGSVAADACLIDNPGAPAGSPPFFISTDGGLEGDVRFFNNGTVQTAFNGGDPYLVWFAPITFDALSTIGATTFPTYENGGSCVSVNPDAAFAVVYLNRITTANLSTNNCTGSFDIDGGLPEWRPGDQYNIEVYLTSDRNITGGISNPGVQAGGRVTFSVPQAGNYTIEIRDGKGCLATTLTADFTACVPADVVTVEVDTIIATPGATVCVPVFATGFQNIFSFQFGLDYDETKLRFINFQNINISPFGPGDFADDGSVVSLVAASFSAPYNIPDGGVLFEMCFEVLGVEGEFAPITLVPPGASIIEFSSPSGTLNSNLIPGGVIITTNTLALLAQQAGFGCGGEDENFFFGRVFGGTAPYTVTFALQGAGPGVTTVTVNQENEPFVTPANLSPGTYNLNVTDAAGNTDMLTITLIDGPTLGVNIDPLSLLRCFGDENGALIARPTLDFVQVASPGGDYQYSWNTLETSQGISGLSVGNYSVTVTDQRGCMASANRTLVGRPQLRATLAVTDASCEGIIDGEVLLNLSGGTPDGANYTIIYTDEDGTATPVVSQNLTINSDPERYTIRVIDDNGCQLDTFALVEPMREVGLTTTLDPISCAGADDAEIRIIGTTVSGTPQPPYTFVWSPSNPTDITNTNTQSTYVNLGQGVVSVVATDADGCLTRDTFTIVEPTQVQIGLVDSGNESCDPGMDGFAEVLGSGGRALTTGYTYQWRDASGAVVSSQALASGLTEGFYQAFVTDESGCIDSFPAPFEITAPDRPLIVTLDDVALSCNGFNDGSLTVVAQATAQPIDRIEWSNTGFGSTIVDLVAGEYIVSVFDQAGCVSRDTALVTEPDPLAIDVQVVTNPPCFEGGDGEVTLTMMGGTAPYTFQWSNGINGLGENSITGPTITSGQYDVIVTDANNCPTFTESFLLDDPLGIDPNFDVTSVVEAPCAEGRCEGGLTINPTLPGNAAATFNITWDSGETSTGAISSTATMLCPGRIEVDILTIGSICPAQTFSYDIPAPPPLITSLQTREDVRCAGESNGRILIDETIGGTPGFTYAWTFGGGLTATGVELNNLPAGPVDLEVMDANGCLATEQYDINEPLPLDALLDTAGTLTPTCFGEQNGVISVVPVGGNDSQPYTFRWNDVPNRNSGVARDVPAGNYTVLVTDFKGCTDSLVYTLDTPPEIEFVLSTPDPILCFGDLTQLAVLGASGGQGLTDDDFLVSINNSSLQPIGQEFPVQGGIPLSVVVSDPAECTAETEVILPAPNQIVINLPETVEVELGDSIRLRPDIFPGGANILFDSIQWTPNDNISFRGSDLVEPFVSPLSETTYTITVMDADGCSRQESILVTVDRNRNVFIPNAFSPNGDANNDEFKIFTGPGVLSINFLRVFDRWGNEVYTQDNIGTNDFGQEATWDGTYRGRLVNPDVFVYLAEIEFLDGRTIVYKGDVNVVY